MLKFLCLIFLIAAVGAASVGQNFVGQKRHFTEQENDAISEFLRRLLNNLKEAMPNGIPELSIPPLDPLDVPEINAHIKEGIADVNLHMKDLNMVGLSSFVVREAKGDLNTMTFSLDLFLPEIVGRAHYDLDGKVLIFPLYGKGLAGLKVDDLHFKGTASINIIDMKMIQLTNFDLHVEFSQIQMYLENIIGGGDLGNIVNNLINMMGKLLYDKFKDQLLPVVNRIAKDAINEKLKDLNLQDIIGGITPPSTPYSVSPVQESVNTYIDRLMEELRPYLKENNLDPMELPEVGTSFRRKILGITWHGGAKIHNGDLNSLSTIHRVGDFQLKNEETKMTVKGAVGINGMWGSFKAMAWFMGIRVSAGVQFSVNTVRVRAQISADFDSDSELVQLDEFSIAEVSGIKVKITGLGVLGWVLTPLANLVVNAVRGKIVAAIEDPIRREIIKLLANVALPQVHPAQLQD